MIWSSSPCWRSLSLVFSFFSFFFSSFLLEPVTSSNFSPYILISSGLASFSSSFGSSTGVSPFYCLPFFFTSFLVADFSSSLGLAAALVTDCWISISFLAFSSSDSLIALYSTLSFWRFLNKWIVTRWRWNREDWKYHQQKHLQRCCWECKTSRV